MKPGARLQLKLGQKLKLAPQLRQAIALLQLNRLELKDHIQNSLDSNPLLERPEDRELDQPDSDGQDSVDQDNQIETGEDFGFDELPDGFSVTSQAPRYDEFIGDQAENSLQHHLLWQVNLSRFSPSDESIAKAIIYALNEDGYLQDDLETLRASLAPEQLASISEVAAVLERVQHLEPVGVGSRSLQECLVIQLNTQPSDRAGVGLATHLVQYHLESLGRHDPGALARSTGFPVEDIQQALQLIRSLNPHPGSRFGNERENYVVPDVYVTRTENGWRVSLNPDSDPGLRLNKTYMNLLRQSRGDNKQYLKDRLQEARWLISGLEMRNQTLMAVTEAIIKRQQSFLEHGEIGMQPLLQREIAEAVDVHESTVSRATTQKYAHTPRGTFELKHFFSVGLPSGDGKMVSATAIKARLRRMISEEPLGKPCSDQSLTDQLGEQGVHLARRTVAKYREQLGIPGSAQRRRQAHSGA